MTRSHRLLLLLLAALAAALLALGGPGAARADDDDRGEGNDDNTAVAVNTKDGSSLFRFAFDIHTVASDVVDNVNAAVAYASCTSCETTAIAIQIVFVIGDAETVAPENYAVAVNENCTLCETFASAYQFVVTTDGPVRFTGEGRRAIARIKREVRALRDPDLTPAERQARLDVLMDELRQVLRTEVVPRRGGERDDEDGDGDDDRREREREQPETTASVETETGTATTEPATTETETETATTESTPTATIGTTTETAP